MLLDELYNFFGRDKIPEMLLSGSKTLLKRDRYLEINEKSHFPETPLSASKPLLKI